MPTDATVAVVGAGAMGGGLAVQFARHGARVALVDHRQANLDDVQERIRESVAFLREADLTDDGPDALLDRIALSLDPETAVADADLVIESVPEDREIKREVFRTVAPAAPADAVLASNTSGIPITEIAAAVPEHADRVAGCHWWFPPYLLAPVEVVRGAETSPETVARLEALVEAVGRDPIRVERDVPGFVWNRVQFAVVRECLHIVEEGIASAADVNRAIRDGYATRTAAIGPFETMDVAGLDLFETIAADLYPALADDDAPGEYLSERVADGRTGIDAGEGIFEYDDPPEAVTRRRDERVAAVRRALSQRDAE